MIKLKKILETIKKRDLFEFKLVEQKKDGNSEKKKLFQKKKKIIQRWQAHKNK